MEKYRSRNYRMLLYPEDASHSLAIEKLQAGQFRFVAILHDKDIDEDGTLKKPHWHVVVKFPQPRWNTAVAKEFGIEENYIMSCESLDGAILYLVHAEHPDKYQYEASEAFGTLLPSLNKLLAEDDEGSRVLEIVKLIDDSPGKCGYREILVKSCNAGLYGEFRRLGSGVKWLIDEHNEEFIEAFNKNKGVNVSYEAFNEYLRWTSSKTDDVQPRK